MLLKHLWAKYGKPIKIFLVTLTIFFAALFIFKDSIFHWSINIIRAKIENKTNAHIRLFNPVLHGINSVQIDSLEIVYPEKNLKLNLYQWESQHSFLNPLKLKRLKIDSVAFHSDTVENNNLTVSKADSAKKGSLFQRLPEWLEILPDNIYIGSVKFNTNRPLNLSLNMYDLKKADNFYSARLQSSNYEVSLEGNLWRKFKGIQLDFLLKDAQQYRPLKMPLFEDLILVFDSIKSQIHLGMSNDDYIDIKFDAYKTNLYHHKIADDTVRFNHVHMKLKMKKDKNTLYTTQHHVINFDNLFMNLFLNLDFSEKSIEFILEYPNKDAKTFFASLNPQLFPNLHKFDVQGNLYMKMALGYNQKFPDSSYVDFQFSPKNFKILNDGGLNISKVNQGFMHRVKNERDSLSFWVGPENPDFTPLSKITPFLIYAVLTSEDAAFFRHKGILPSALTSSLRDNLKKGRFARGGSTISMQLVKNLFLHRKKTISRKMEELILTSIIEQMHLISKERMLEIYFNIIEWGPGIYGINQAGRFYFDKQPNELDLNEAIFLAMIIPAPSKFYYFLDSKGQVKASCENYFKIVAGHMLKRNQIDTVVYQTVAPSSLVFSSQVKKMLNVAYPSADTLQEPIILFDSEE